MTQQHDGAHHCQRCGAPVTTSWHLPTVCPECKASFEPRPRWIVSVVFGLAAAISLLSIALVRLVTTNTIVFAICFLLVAFVSFHVLQILLFKLNALRLTNVNARDDLNVALSPTDPDALTKAEDIVRSKNLAGSTKDERAAQAKQLKESIELAKSLRSGNEEHASSASSRTPSRANAAGASRANAKAPRCRFARVSATNEVAIQRMSALSTRIVREHFDPIIGPEQNDYMIERFHSVEAIAQNIEDGYEYYFVLPPKQPKPSDGSKAKGVRPLGFVALQPRENRELYLSKFYLVKEQRGKGYARSMMRVVARRAHELGCDHVRLCVNRNNYQAILAYEHLGFVRMGEQRTDIGNGFVMDDFVYELHL